MDFDKALVQHKDLYLFVDEENNRIMFNLLDYESYKVFRYIFQYYPEFKFDIEDKIWDKCVIEHTHSQGKEFLPAGLVTTIAQLILYFSCPSSVSDLNMQLNDARMLVKEAREQAIIAICEAFPSYLPENLEKLTWPVLLRRLAQAEEILKRELEFKDATSQPIDDSAKIFERLDDYVNETIDFDQVNNNLLKEEYSNPSGDFNLRNTRG